MHLFFEICDYMQICKNKICQNDPYCMIRKDLESESTHI